MGSKGVQNLKERTKLYFFWLIALKSYWVEKIGDFMYFDMTNPKFSKIIKITEKTEKFLPIFVIEIFKLDFWIPGKILSGILVLHFC